MTHFISRLHEDLRRVRKNLRGATHDAKDVPQGRHKEYPRMLRIELPPPERLEVPLFDALAARTSYTHGSEAPLSPALFGSLLGAALGKKGKNGRHYPSGGALYPIETYVLTRSLTDDTLSALHYNPSRHALEVLWPIASELKEFVPKPPELRFSAVIVFTAVWKRSSAKYGDFTYDLALLEAGHMSENMLLTATALSIDARPMAGFEDELVAKALDLDTREEQPVLALVLSVRE